MCTCTGVGVSTSVTVCAKVEVVCTVHCAALIIVPLACLCVMEGPQYYWTGIVTHTLSCETESLFCKPLTLRLFFLSNNIGILPCTQTSLFRSCCRL